MSTFKHSSESHITITELMLPSHSNFSGKIHGGYILSLMDQVAFACAAKLVTLQAAVNFVGRSSMVVGIRVEAENIKTGEKKHCNSSFFTMVAKNDEGKTVAVPGLILKTTDDIRRFVRSAQRQQQGKTRRNKFTEATFKHEEHLDLLDAYNVQVSL